MMSQHFSMIKDVQNSIEITDHLSQLLPFVNYKWELRVINSSAWPESALKIRFSHMYPFFDLDNHLRCYGSTSINFRIYTNSTEVLLSSGNSTEAPLFFRVSSQEENGDFRLKICILSSYFISTNSPTSRLPSQDFLNSLIAKRKILKLTISRIV